MVPKSPIISIVTPSFNQAKFLELTVQSVLNQKYPNLEYIVIDGGSNDGSLDIIKKYEKYFHFWCSESDDGQYDAINKGFSHAAGEIMAWINSDDMYLPWALKTVASIFSQFPEVEWLTTAQLGLWDAQGFCVGFYPIVGYNQEAFLDGGYLPWGKDKFGFSLGWIQQESTFWRRSLWEKVGGYINTEFKLASDFDLWSRFYLHADLYATTSPLGGFRRHGEQKTSLNDQSWLQQYAVEAEKSLKNMRQVVNWQTNEARKLSIQLNLNKLPKIKNFVQSKYGYIGKKIIRKNISEFDASWEIQEYKFLP